MDRSLACKAANPSYAPTALIQSTSTSTSTSKTENKNKVEAKQETIATACDGEASLLRKEIQRRNSNFICLGDFCLR